MSPPRLPTRQLALVLALGIAGLCLMAVLLSFKQQQQPQQRWTDDPVLTAEHCNCDTPPQSQPQPQAASLLSPEVTTVRKTTTTTLEQPGRLANCTGVRPELGRVGIFVAYNAATLDKLYTIARQTVKCYALGAGYQLFLVDVDTDTEVNATCEHKSVYFRKHCAAAVYLSKVDWLFVIDGDTGIANPSHCLQEYIDGRYELILYERFFNREIACGGYIARNTPFVRNWLMEYSNYEWNAPDAPGIWTGFDNGPIHLHVLKTVHPWDIAAHQLCWRFWQNSTGLETYYRYVACCRAHMHGRYDWPDAKVKIFRRSLGFVHDGALLTSDKWCSFNFMHHGWKANTIGQGGWDSPFHRLPIEVDCRAGAPWPHRPEKRVDCARIRQDLNNVEPRMDTRKLSAIARRAGLPHLMDDDVGHCWPHCGQ